MSVFYEREEEEKMTIENIPSAKTFVEDLTFYNEVINNIDLTKIIKQTDNIQKQRICLLQKIPYTVYKITSFVTSTPLYAIFYKYAIEEITDNELFYKALVHYPFLVDEEKNYNLIKHIINISYNNHVSLLDVINITKIVCYHKYDDLIQDAINLYFNSLSKYSFFDMPITTGTKSLSILPYIVKHGTDEQICQFIDLLIKDRVFIYNPFVWNDVEKLLLQRFSQSKIKSIIDLSNLSI